MRVLVQQTSDNRIKNDMNLNAFLTFDENKYKQYKQNPSPYLDKMWAAYNLLPSIPTQKDIIGIQQQGVTSVAK